MKVRLATALHGGIGRDGNGRSIGWRSTVSTRPSPWLGKMPFGSTSSSLTLYGQGRHYPTGIPSTQRRSLQPPPNPPQRRGPCHVQQCSSLELVGSKVRPFMLTTVRDSDDLTLQGLDQDELLDNFFASPACQPWHWMGNLNGYRGSPCHGTSLGFIQRQLALQKRVVARQVALGTEALSRRHFGNSMNLDGGTTPTLERGCSAPPSGSSRVGSKGLLTLFTRVFTIGMPSQV